MRARKNYATHTQEVIKEVAPASVEEAKEEIFPIEEKVSTKRKNKKTLLEIMEEEE
jgi:hypothetical protein